MTSPIRFVPAVSLMVLSSMLVGCVASQQKTGFGGKANENVGLATRAVLALNAKDVPSAIDFAERAVEKNPQDAGFRAILGNAYFAGGRFWSAEAAYKDALTIYSNQPQVILKLALVETALGKKDEAVAFLEAGRSVLDASNFGLALALAGRPADAVPVLEAAAREKGADSTVRQNLALAHALAGDWSEAKTIASQDVPANELDARIHQWMQLASPKKPSDQVASLIGVTPAAVDHGQPIRLALSKTETRFAEAAPAPRTVTSPVTHSAPAPLVQPAPEPQVAQVAPMPPAPKFVEAVAGPDPAPAAAPAVAPAPVAKKPAARPVIVEASLPAPVAMLAAAASGVSTAVEALMPKKPQAATHNARPRRVAARTQLRPGDTVIQLGSYRSPHQVSAGWTHLSDRFPALRAYLPMKARFDSPKGTFWRLSIQGFSNQREAITRCQQLKSRGGNCFVRGFAGDAPVQYASN
jgi:Flp pilus assembly protein TadD